MINTIKDKKKALLYAPNVHTGGGLVLLKSLIKGWPYEEPLEAVLDIRCQQDILSLNDSNFIVKHWVKPNVISRIWSEINIFFITKRNTLVLCFHNIPPIFSRSNFVNVFLQNRLILEGNLLKLTNTKIFLTINLERLITKISFTRPNQYIVQTLSMQYKTKKWLTSLKSSAKKITVTSIPFQSQNITARTPSANPIKDWDFLYVSSGEPHKNHETLLDAWKALGDEGIYPILTLTIGNSHTELLKKIDELSKSLSIVNLGYISHQEALMSYARTKAFIFPSLCESLSQPLVEAYSNHLPIIASELDFVRDVCIPKETFDPNSAISISRAVKRFLGLNSDIEPLLRASEFWEKIYCSQ